MQDWAGLNINDNFRHRDFSLKNPETPGGVSLVPSEVTGRAAVARGTRPLIHLLYIRSRNRLRSSACTVFTIDPLKSLHHSCEVLDRRPEGRVIHD